MSLPKIEILDWGRPGRPLCATVNGQVLLLKRPLKPSSVDQRCADYAMYQAETLPKLGPGPMLLHLGFYGYLRIVNSMFTQCTGISIFDIGDVMWRDWYDDEKPPMDALEDVLEENYFPGGLSE